MDNLNTNTNLLYKEDTKGNKESIEEKEKSNQKDGIIYTICKKIIDITAGIIGTVVLIPLTVIVYFLRIINNENDGPIFYTQLRIGKNGKAFKLYKYRTMVINADEKLYKYLEENEEAREEYKKYKKIKNDPRITKTGKILRKTSLDEFPQMINILQGKMSLVGPRPYLHREKEDMGTAYNTIIKVQPGITGYWQVNGRSDVDFANRIYMDTYYIEHKSLIMDIKIIIKTIMKIFKKEGAI